MGYSQILPGEVRSYGGSAAPNGWYICDGSSKTVAGDPALFAAIGYTYGGSGANFNLPDARGRVIVGVGAGSGLTTRTLGEKSGAETHTLTSAQIPAHTHPNTLTDGGHRHYGYTTGSGGDGLSASWSANNATVSSNPSQVTQSATTGISINNANNTGGGGSHNNMQPYLAFNVIIKR